VVRDEKYRFCQLLEPTVGGINLENRPPNCFYIEQRLRETLRIPSPRRPQTHGRLFPVPALLNALLLVKKTYARSRSYSQAPRGPIATAEHYVRLGVRRENIVMCDTRA